jgi:hypothetical protein
MKRTAKRAKAKKKARPSRATGKGKRVSGARTGKVAKTGKAKSGKPLKADSNGVVYLSGGNPQIAMADGDAPVQAYIAAMPGWKKAVGKRLDEIIVRTLPNVAKAVKWNSPFYGVEGRGYFMALHVFTKYIKVTFFRGASMKPIPPGPSKDPNTRYLNIYENEALDEAQFVSWVKQGAELPGWLAPKT